MPVRRVLPEPVVAPSVAAPSFASSAVSRPANVDVRGALGNVARSRALATGRVL